MKYLLAVLSMGLTVLLWKLTGQSDAGLAFDPLTIASIAKTGADIYSMFAGGGGGGESTQIQDVGVTESDIFSRLRNRLGAETGIESDLAGLQQGLFRAGVEGLGRMPGELSLDRLAQGEISRGARDRINRQAFGGFNEAIRRANAAAGSQALSRGLGMSSVEQGIAADLQRPIVERAGGLAAALESQELGRLEGLRERFLANSMALQNSPALQRLLQIRMAEAEQENLQLTREPGQLPDEISREAGLTPEHEIPFEEKNRRIQQALQEMNAQLIAQGVPKHTRNRTINNLRRALAARYGVRVGGNYEILP